MKKFVGLGILLSILVIAGVRYFSKGTSHPTASTGENNDAGTGSTLLSNEVKQFVYTDGQPSGAAPQRENNSAQTLNDPRLAALKVSPNTGNIEFVPDKNGRIIKEIDNNQGSLSYKKPLREYTYAGDKVIGLTAYQYLPDYTQIKETKVSYNADGSILDYHESIDYLYAKKKKR